MSLVIIAGLPRSGTSFLTRVVHEMTGYSLGQKKKFKKGDIHNPDGYFEHLELNKLTVKLEKQLSANFFDKIPVFEQHWQASHRTLSSKIKHIIDKEKIELYKDNRLLVYADLYSEIFKDAKWIYIERNYHETYLSRFGQKIEFNDWSKICSNRKEAWERTSVSKTALSLDYSDFQRATEETVYRIANHLDFFISSKECQRLANLFRKKTKS